jgi:hypothetical protein
MPFAVLTRSTAKACPSQHERPVCFLTYLEDSTVILLSTLAHDFLTKAEDLIADPWAMSALPDFIYPKTTGVRPKDLGERLNLQKGLGRLAARDAAVFELLIDVRNLLKPLNVLDDPSIVGRIENEVASELSLSSAAQVA